jgi:mannosyltransferase
MKNLASFFKSEKVQVSTLLLLTFILGVINLTGKSLWVDEVFSINIAKLDIHSMFQYLNKSEGNMWLYYLILHYWVTILGTSEFAVRFLSVIVSTFSVFAVYKFAKENFSKKTALISSLVLSLNFFFIFDTQETRSYAFFILFSALSSLYFLRATRKGERKNWIIFTVISILNLYTHFYAGFLIFAQGLYLCLYKLRDEKINIFKSLSYFFIISIGFLPALISPSFRGNQLNWISPPEIMELPFTFVVFAGDNPLLAIVFGLILLFYLYSIIIKKEYLRKLKNEELYLALAITSTFFISFAFSYIVKPIYQTEYHIFLLPLFIVLITGIIERYESLSLRRVLYFIVIVSSILRLTAWYTGSDHLGFIFENKKEEWRQSTNYIIENTKPNDAIIFFSYFGKNSYNYYLNKFDVKVARPEFIEVASGKYLDGGGGGNNLPKPNQTVLLNLPTKYDRVWLFLSNYKSHDPKTTLNISTSQIVKTLESLYPKSRIKDFYKIRIILFER